VSRRSRTRSSEGKSRGCECRGELDGRALNIHPRGCSCGECRLTFWNDGSPVDPDSMEDEAQPYFWNRR